MKKMGYYYTFVKKIAIFNCDMDVFSVSNQGCQVWHSDWVGLAPNGTSLGLIMISFSIFCLGEPTCIEVWPS